MPKSIVFLGGVLLVAAQTATAQPCEPRWTEIRPQSPVGEPVARRFAAGFWDNQGLLVFGGFTGSEPLGDTWRFDGAAWSSLAPSSPIGLRYLTSAGIDPVTSRPLIFGGRTVDAPVLFFGDTWAWESGSWVQVATGGPSTRRQAQMTQDPARGKLVLFGGLPPSGPPLADTWEWTGSAWAQIPVAGPPARSAGVMVRDPAGVLLVGGRGASGLLADSGRWDGAAWTSLTATPPPVRELSAAVYDPSRGRTVLFGGRGAASVLLGDTWEWDGSSWTQIPGPGPEARFGHVMVYDPVASRVLLFGGSSATSNVSDVWAYTASGWQQLRQGAFGLPLPRDVHSLAFDRDRRVLVLFGGNAGTRFGDTWEFDGTAWRRAATTGPSPRMDAAMHYDRVSRRTILFGGLDQTDTRLDETWAWDGVSWQRLSVPGPSARHNANMTFDSARGVLVLYGGSGPAGVPRTDTWEWNGSAWAEVVTAANPGPSASFLAYDTARSRTVLYNNATWEYDGSNWTQIQVQGPPRSRGRSPLVYDEYLQKVVLHDGCGFPPCNDLWTYDGQAWTQAPAAGPVGRFNHNMVYDSAGRRMLMFAGRTDNLSLDDLWSLSSVPTGDWNYDGVIDFNDLLEFLNDFNALDPRADLNADGAVDFNDLLEFLNAYNTPC